MAGKYGAITDPPVLFDADCMINCRFSFNFSEWKEEPMGEG